MVVTDGLEPSKIVRSTDLQSVAIAAMRCHLKIVIEFIVHLDKIIVIFNMNCETINCLATEGIT